MKESARYAKIVKSMSPEETWDEVIGRVAADAVGRCVAALDAGRHAAGQEGAKAAAGIAGKADGNSIFRQAGMAVTLRHFAR